MIRILWAILVLAFSNQMQAEEIHAETKLSEVTVYRVLAKELRNGTVTIPKGTTEVIISDVSLNMIDNSLQVAVNGNATLVTASTRTNYFSQEINANNKAVTKIKDTIQEIDDELSWMSEQKAVYNGEINLINANNKLGGTEGFQPGEVTTLADIYRARVMELKKKIYDIGLKERDLRAKREKYQGQLNEMSGKKSSPVKELVLSFSSETGASLTLKCSYLVSSAGWSPMYDIKVLNTNSPVNLDYKAKIYQNTGFDWKDVKITVSTGNPNRENSRPILNPKFVDFTYYAPKPSYSGGYNAPVQMMEKSNMAMDISRDGDGVEDLREGNEAYNYDVNVNENQLNVEFEIDIIQNIPSDGKEHVCAIQSYKVPATYKYHVVPKLDQSAFLLAKVTDYGQYNLLPGTANIFFEDMYVGQSAINPNTSGDTMLLSLGRDDKIVVKRTKIVDKTSTKTIGGSKKETYAWETMIRNNKGTAIDIEILDQVPISKNKEIEVELLEYDGAQYTEEYGKLLWNITIKPNETKKVKLVYSIKYPQDKTIQEF